MRTQPRTGVVRGSGDKISNKAEELGGKLKAGAGEATDNPDLKAEGRADQFSANVKQSGEDIKDVLRDVAGVQQGDEKVRSDRGGQPGRSR